MIHTTPRAMASLQVLLAGASVAFGQPSVEGQYVWASLSVKPGVAFEARSQSGVLTLTAAGLRDRQGAAFTINHPGAAGAAPIRLTADAAGGVLAAAGAAIPEIFIALRAAAGPASSGLAPGDWSAAAVTMAAGKARGLATAFADFTVGPNGVSSGAWDAVAHEASVDDVARAEKWPVAKSSQGMIEFGPGSAFSGRYEVRANDAGDMFLAVPAGTAPPNPTLIVALRRDREASTMSLRGPYALAELGARESFAFAPEAPRFYSTSGSLEASGGLAMLAQRVHQPDRPVDFRGLVAYMVNPGGAGSFGVRLEQRRRNLAVSANAGVFLTAQVPEPGQLSLLHGIGIGVRLGDVPAGAAPAVAPIAVLTGETLSLYGRGLSDKPATTQPYGVQVVVDGQPVQVLLTAPNQINVRLAKATTAGAKLKVEIDRPGSHVGPVEVTAAAAGPTSGVDLAPGVLLPPEAHPRPGDKLDLFLTGGSGAAASLVGATVLIDGQLAGEVRTTAPYSGADPARAGTVAVQVAVPAYASPGPLVGVAVVKTAAFTDVGTLTVLPRPLAPPPSAGAHH